MTITDRLRAALRRLGSTPPERRRTAPLPTIFQTYSPRTEALPKPTPANLRRFAETPLARKAINTIKDRVAGMRRRVHRKKFREGLGKVIDGTVQCLNASTWAKR